MRFGEIGSGCYAESEGSMGGLLVVGAINTDLIAFVERAPRAGETVAGGHFEQHGGGKAANQAVAAARSGAGVALLSAVGDDDFGTARLDALKAEGIDISAISTLEGVASGVAIIVVESTGENRICDLPGAREQMTPDQCIRAYERVQPAAILAANELPFDCHRALFEQARQDGIPVWFNVAPFSPDARELMPLVHTLIVNQGEAEDILDVRGQDQSIDELVTGLRDLGVDRVVITLGGDGVRGIDAEGDHSVPAVTVTPVDTTGAGDTFCGAWASEMIRGASFEEALAYANRAAAISVTRRGAQSSITLREEVASPS